MALTPHIKDKEGQAQKQANKYRTGVGSTEEIQRKQKEAESRAKKSK